MKKYKVGFIGYGNMAKAIVSALIKKEKLNEKEFDVIVFDVDDAKLAKAKEKSIAVANDNADLISKSDFVVIAVKPQMANIALNGCDFSEKVVISIMAGMSINAIEKITNHTASKIARVMPNLNAKNFASCTSYCTKGLDAEEELVVKSILESFGTVTEVKEEQMDAVTGLCGSGPAFVYKFINAFIQSAKNYGFPQKDALIMSLQTILGSVQNVMLSANGDEIDVNKMVDAVCSKGGTTIEGVNFLNEKDFESIVIDAIDKSVFRAKEMSRQNEEC
jgi:pyrroline-5-carboxylate reductase